LRDVTRYNRTLAHRMQKRRQTGNRREIGITVTKDQFGADEFSEVFEVPWEVILNDDLNELTKITRDMSLAASTFEDMFVNSLYNNTTSQAYLVSLGALYAGTAALDKAGLVAGITAMTTRRTTDGSNALINPGAIRLVVGPALAYTASELIANILAYGATESNILSQFISGVSIDPFIVPVSTKNPWYLFADPRGITSVPVLRLQGVTKPYVFTQESNVRVISGTAPAALSMGNYVSGVLSYTVGTIIGGNAHATKGGIINPNGLYYSTG